MQEAGKFSSALEEEVSPHCCLAGRDFRFIDSENSVCLELHSYQRYNENCWRNLYLFILYVENHADEQPKCC